jgi:hypothetical protein
MIDCRSSRARLQKDALAGDSGVGGGMTLNCIAHSHLDCRSAFLWSAAALVTIVIFSRQPPGFRHLVQTKAYPNGGAERLVSIGARACEHREQHRERHDDETSDVDELCHRAFLWIAARRDVWRFDCSLSEIDPP